MQSPVASILNNLIYNFLLWHGSVIRATTKQHIIIIITEQANRKQPKHTKTSLAIHGTHI